MLPDVNETEKSALSLSLSLSLRPLFAHFTQLCVTPLRNFAPFLVFLFPASESSNQPVERRSGCDRRVTTE